MRKPAIELHYHLDGSVTPSIARNLAALQNIALPESEEELCTLLSLPPACESLNDFLKCFTLPLSLLQTKESIRQAVFLEQEAMKEQGILYAEIRFAPQLHCEKGLTQRQVIEAALEGLQASDLPCNLILCCMRGKDTSRANLETLILASEYLTDGDIGNEGVVALDLAGAEGLFPTDDYRELFSQAQKLGIPFTIHAGEADGAHSVRTAIDMGASRIGHGIRSIEDEALLELLALRKIPLEMCPTSNRRTKAVDDMNHYPLTDFLKRGLCVTINTDDCAICRTTLFDEFQYLEDRFHLTDTDCEQLSRNAVNAAFTGRRRKEQLMEALKK